MRRPEPTVRLLPADAAGDAAVLASITAIINAAFGLSEGSMFVPGRERIDDAEVAGLIRDGHLAVAELDGQVIGCVRVAQLGGDVGQWGLLAVSPDRHGLGIGSRLVRFAEDRLASAGCREIEIQLLTPADPGLVSPTKAASAAWYARLGYARGARLDFAALHPAAAADLVVGTDFATYMKSLPVST